LSGELRRGQARRELDQRERVSERDLDELLRNQRSGTWRQSRRKELSRRGAIQSAEPELGDSRRGEGPDLGLAYAEEHRDAVRIEAARDEGHRSGRSLVQPVGVVDHAQQRLLFRDGRKQTQGAAEGGETLATASARSCRCRPRPGRRARRCAPLSPRRARRRSARTRPRGQRASW
jgi:hypothetical protein